jgi:tripartite-type tricarboxylate transporter receptor subunit TctC
VKKLNSARREGIKQIARGLLACTLAFAAGTSLAQDAWPAKPVRIVVTFTPGGSADMTARVVAERLSEMWKQQVLIENRIGAGGNIGVEAVYRSAADGYTLLLASGAQPINVALYPKLPFDLFKDFAGLGLVTSTPMALAVNPSVKDNNLREFTARVRASGGKAQYATCGVATGHHFAFELYKFKTKVDAQHIPYKGCGAAVVETVGGQVDTVLTSLNTVLAHQKSGKLKVLAITSKNRSASAPDIPTFAESGVPELKDYDANIYYGFMAPAATPKDVLTKIETDIRRVMAMPEVQKRLTSGGLELFPKTGSEMMAIMRSDADQIKKIVDFAGIKPE